MKDTSGIIYRRGCKPISLLWHFTAKGEPYTLSICPHDRSKPSRLIMFENGRAAWEVIDQGTMKSDVRRLA